MMNVLALSLVLTSLAAAGVFSPTPPPSTIVKDGHRVVVVEYDQDGHHNTKISISPPQPESESEHEHEGSGMLSSAKDKIKEAASVLPNVGQGISTTGSDGDPAFLHASRDLICDAYGSCKHKIADAMGKAKDKAQEVLHSEIAAKREAARDVKDLARESVEKAKDTGEAVKSHVVRNASHVRDILKTAAATYVRQLDSLMGAADLMGFATAYGMCVWVTFISSYVLSRAMPRQQFAVVQSKIYPVYFRAMAYSISLALLGHLFSHTNTLFSSRAQLFQACNLAASLFTLLLNSLYLEPRATKLMFERMKMEKEEGRGRDDLAAPEQHSRTTTEEPKESAATAAASPTPGVEHDAIRSKIIKLNERLKKLNSYSSILNILNLMSLTWHLVYLAQKLHHVC